MVSREPSKAFLRILNGYRVVYEPENPSAMRSQNWNGYVYEHVSVAEKALGRPLRKGEVVHHLDGNRGNNRKENLLVLEKEQHGRLHAWLEKGAPYLERVRVDGVNSEEPTVGEEKVKYCEVCSKTLQGKQKTFCSNKCSGLSNRRCARPEKDVLEREMKSESFLALGRKYGVTDNAVRKWARRYELL